MPNGKQKQYVTHHTSMMTNKQAKNSTSATKANKIVLECIKIQCKHRFQQNNVSVRQPNELNSFKFLWFILKSKPSFAMSLISKICFPSAIWMKSHLGDFNASSLNKAYIHARTQHTSKCNPFNLIVVGGSNLPRFWFHHHSFVSKFKYLSFNGLIRIRKEIDAKRERVAHILN